MHAYVMPCVVVGVSMYTHVCGGERTTLGKLVLSFYFYVGSGDQTQVVRLEWQVLIVCVYKCACACILRPLVHARAYIQRPEDNL